MDKINFSKNNTIHLALGFDNNYVVHIYAMLASVLHNNKRNHIIFHTVATGISTIEKEKLKAYIVDNNAEIIYYEITNDLLKANIELPGNSYFPIATFYRLFFPALLPPDVKMLLYIDPDTIVIDDLKELYNIDIGNAPLAATLDTYPEIREDLGLKERCFNGGVLLIDLKSWREQKITEKVLEYVKMFPEKVKYLDQDGLNAILKDNYFKLDIKYNFTISDVILQVPSKELIKDKVIIHFNSSRKPWNFLTRNKLRFLYHYYLKMSPKSNEKIYTDFNWNLKSLWIFTRIRIKEFYFNHKFDKVFLIKKWVVPSDDY